MVQQLKSWTNTIIEKLVGDAATVLFRGMMTLVAYVSVVAYHKFKSIEQTHAEVRDAQKQIAAIQKDLTQQFDVLKLQQQLVDKDKVTRDELKVDHDGWTQRTNDLAALIHSHDLQLATTGEQLRSVLAKCDTIDGKVTSIIHKN
jgi:hypothetical protein